MIFPGLHPLPQTRPSAPGVGDVDVLNDEARAQAATRGGRHRTPEQDRTPLGALAAGELVRQVKLGCHAYICARRRPRPPLTTTLDAEPRRRCSSTFANTPAGRMTLLISHRFQRRPHHRAGRRAKEEGSHHQLMAAGGRHAELLDVPGAGTLGPDARRDTGYPPDPLSILDAPPTQASAWFPITIRVADRAIE